MGMPKQLNEKLLSDWKKAKPLTLRKTGISELLRTLPKDPTQVQLAIYAKVETDLNTKSSDRKIQAEKKALACVKALQKEIHDYLASIATQRAKAVDMLKKIHVVAHNYYQTMAKPGRTVALANSFIGDTAAFRNQIDMITDRSRDKVIVPNSLMVDFREHLDEMDVHCKTMSQAVQDALDNKPVGEWSVSLKKGHVGFGKEMAELPGIYNKIAALKP